MQLAESSFSSDEHERQMLVMNPLEVEDET